MLDVRKPGNSIAGESNDGAGGPSMPEGWLDERCEWLANAHSQEELKKLFEFPVESPHIIIPDEHEGSPR